MKWLIENDNGTVEFDKYFEYIESIKSELSESVYEFASNWNIYSMESSSSLHDCWVHSLNINETGIGERKEIRECEITLTLLGAFHDRFIKLSYIGVKNYNFKSTNLGVANRGHSDLLIHEIRLSDDGLIEHEIHFSNGGKFEISFSDLSIIEISI